MKTSDKIKLGLVSAVAVVAIGLWSLRESAPVKNLPVHPTAKAPPITAPAAIPDQPASTSPTPSPARPQRKFGERDVLERRAILMEIEKQDLPSVFQSWLEAGRAENDLTKQLAIRSMMAGLLMYGPPNPAFLKQLQEFIEDSSNSMSERGQLIFLLGGAATKESVEVLVHLALTLPEQELRNSASSSVRRTVGPSSIRGDGSRHEELSPPLERAWRESQDQNLLGSVAIALVHVGAADGIRLLLAEALNEKGDDVRTRAARKALTSVNILNPSAVPPLAALLANQTSGTAATQLAADTLNRSGIPEASDALFQWLQIADDNVAPWAHRYAVMSRTPAQLKAWQLASDPAMSFRSEKVREAIRAGLTEYQQSRKFETVK